MVTKLSPQDQLKAVQAAAYLLKRVVGHAENYTKLLKILYLADRRAIELTGDPISGTAFVNMANGPLASDVYNLIKGEADCSIWSRFIVREGFDIRLIADPGDGQLSEFDEEILNEMWAAYAPYDFRKMIDIVHKVCPEWHDPSPAKMEWLTQEDILKAVRPATPAERVAEIVARNEHVRAVGLSSPGEYRYSDTQRW